MTKEALASINGVKNGRFLCTIRAHKRSCDLDGSLCKVDLDGQSLLCRMGRIDLTNAMHSDPAFQPLIAARGSIEHFSKNADIEQTEIEVVSCVSKATGNLEQQKGNPPSGTPVGEVTDADIQAFVREKKHLMFIGTMPGNPLIRMSIVNKHYGPDTVDDGGHGEAKHRGYFGKNGSGKTVMALAQLAGRLVAHPQLGCLIPDTAGDIANAVTHQRRDFQFSFPELLERGGRRMEVVSIEDVRLEKRKTLQELVTRFLEEHSLGKAENIESLVDRTVPELFQPTVNIRAATFKQLMSRCADNAGYGWAAQTARGKMDTIRDKWVDDAYLAGEYEEQVAKFFKGRHTINDIIRRVLNNAEVFLIRMDQMSPHDQRFVMLELFKNLTWQTERAFQQKGATVNSEIVLDEAPRWVAQGDHDQIPRLIKDAARTTRKHGLAWTFIGQRPAGVDNEVIAQMHTIWFGRGLGTGADAKHLLDQLGPIGVATYESLELQGGFFWLGVGDEVNLGSLRVPMAVMAYGGNATQALIDNNPHIWR